MRTHKHTQTTCIQHYTLCAESNVISKVLNTSGSSLRVLVCVFPTRWWGIPCTQFHTSNGVLGENHHQRAQLARAQRSTRAECHVITSLAPQTRIVESRELHQPYCMHPIPFASNADCGPLFLVCQQSSLNANVHAFEWSPCGRRTRMMNGSVQSGEQQRATRRRRRTGEFRKVQRDGHQHNQPS